MKYLVTGEEMKLLDTNTSDLFHVPPVVLMEQASGNFVRELFLYQKDIGKILVVCGTGNNGADGIAIARLLNQRGLHAEVLLMGNHGTELFNLQKSIYDAYGYPYYSKAHLDTDKSFDVVVDAIFGIGLSRPVTGVYAKTIEWMNGLCATRYAVDIASGIHATTGAVLGTAFRADYTITFSFGKLGHYLWPGNEYAGKVIVSPMGITADSAGNHRIMVRSLETADLPYILPKRQPHSNKGSYGKLLIIAGCKNMCGAALFAAKAAYRSGSGLVRILTHESNRVILQTSIPEAVLVTYDEKTTENQSQLRALIQEQTAWADAVVAGPGLGTSHNAERILGLLLADGPDAEPAMTGDAFRRKKTMGEKPLLLDADALNLIAASDTLMQQLGGRSLPAVITPHLGEMSRLSRMPVADLQTDLIRSAQEFAKEHHVITVLKDFRTITATQSEGVFMNLTGNDGMATAGSGDVLSGIIGALLGQGMEPQLAAACGVMVHGMAGDAMMERTGRTGMMASDLIEGLNHVWTCIRI